MCSLETSLLHSLKPGDFWSLSCLPASPMLLREIPLGISWNLIFSEDSEILFESPFTTPQPAYYQHFSGNLILEKGIQWTPPGPLYETHLKLINLQPLIFRLVLKPLQAAFPSKEKLEEKGEMDRAEQEDLPLLSHPPVSWSLFQLSRQASLFASTPDFEELLSLPLLRDVDLYEHQIKTVKMVLRRFRGRALLCDEVGLGKTVEAGLILLELFARKLVRRILILTPPSLVAQWQGEMQRKFGLNFTAYDDPLFKELGEKGWQTHDHLLISYHTAKLEPYRSWISREQWDMVIIDEAHHLRNNKTILWKFASSLQKKYILLLTATPMQNSLDDLYNLVTLLKPGLLDTAKRFKKQFAHKGDPFSIKNVEELHQLIAECMVRNRRATLSVHFTKRLARTLRVTPSQEEEQLYQEVTEFVKKGLKQEKSPFSRLSLLSLQKLMGSSSQAVHALLSQMAETNRVRAEERRFLLTLAELAKGQQESAKVNRLVALLKEFPDKMVIFTQFRATQDFLYQVLQKGGFSVVLFHGSLTRMQKEDAITTFREEKQVLISTDSGSEGRNLQFCHAICNFDLPWNPMRIEQRIGRISRLGQSRDVHIFNMVNAHTIEDDVLRILEAKINLFEQVIGEMDMIVGNLEEEREFEEIILDLWVESENQQQFSEKMETFGERLVQAKKDYLQQQAREDQLFGDKFVAKE